MFDRTSGLCVFRFAGAVTEFGAEGAAECCRVGEPILIGNCLDMPRFQRVDDCRMARPQPLTADVPRHTSVTLEQIIERTAGDPDRAAHTVG